MLCVQGQNSFVTWLPGRMNAAVVIVMFGFFSNQIFVHSTSISSRMRKTSIFNVVIACLTCSDVLGLLRNPVHPRRHLAVSDVCTRHQTKLLAVPQGRRGHEKHQVNTGYVTLRLTCLANQQCVIVYCVHLCVQCSLNLLYNLQVQ